MSLQFELVSPERVLYEGTVDAVNIPGSEGDFTALAGHSATMALINAGIVTVTQGNTESRIYIRGGFADLSATKLTILAESALPSAELSVDFISAEIDKITTQLENEKGVDTRQQLELNVARLEDLRSNLR